MSYYILTILNFNLFFTSTEYPSTAERDTLPNETSYLEFN